jgi:hypothetical protein
VPVLSAQVATGPARRYRNLWIPLSTLVTAWEFLRANGSQQREQLCFFAGRVVEGAEGPSAQVTSCILPLTRASGGYVTLTSHAQTALILDHLEEREEIFLLAAHTHGDGGSDGCGPAHSAIDDHGVALSPDNGVFSVVVPYYALGSPFTFPSQCGVHERVDGEWRRLSAEERDARVIVHGDTLRFVRARTPEDP